MTDEIHFVQFTAKGIIWRQQFMSTFTLKHPADFLTFLRCLLGLALVWVGVVEGVKSLALASGMILLGWTTDALDGHLARTWKSAKGTWFGKYDVYVDMYFAGTVLVYLWLSGLLLFAAAFGYLLVWGMVFLRWGMPPLLAQIFQNPIYAYFIVSIILLVPLVLPWLFLWGVTAGLLFRNRVVRLARQTLKTLDDWLRPAKSKGVVGKPRPGPGRANLSKTD
jgi:phosphatidylglycerophosphate synthase